MILPGWPCFSHDSSKCSFSRHRAFSLLGCLLLGGVLAAGAQVRGVSGRQPSLISESRPYIEGRVLVEGEGAPVQAVEVQLRHRSGGELARAYTDTQGEFSFYELSPGSYALLVSHPDYETQSVGMSLFEGPALDVRIVLKPKQAVGSHSAMVSVPLWALKIPGKARKEYRKGWRELEKGQEMKSIARFRAALELYPQFAAAHSALGAAYLRLGDRDEAMTAFEQALEIDDTLIDAGLALGTLYSAQERYGEAERYLVRVRAHKPEEWRVHYELGQLYWRMGEWERAEEALRRGAELHQEFPRLSLLLINVLALQNKYEECVREMDRFLGRFPEDSFASEVRRKRQLLEAELGTSPVPRDNQP